MHSRFKNDIKTAQGLVAHESGHIGYGSFELAFKQLLYTLTKKYDMPYVLVKRIVNVVEDVRINAINKEKFPGFYRNLRMFTMKIMQDIKSKMCRFGDIFIYINLYMEDYEEFQNKPKFRTINISDYDWRAIDVAKRLLLKTLTPTGSIIVTDQLCKILKKYILIKKVRPARSSSSAIVSKISESSGYTYSQEDSEYFDSPERIEHIKDKEYSEDPECLEDPVFIEGNKSIGNVDYPDSIYPHQEKKSTFMNQFEEFETEKIDLSDTELHTSSTELINKLENANITMEDLETLVESIEELENVNNKSENSDKIKKLEENFNEFFDNNKNFQDLGEIIDKKDENLILTEKRQIMKDLIEIISDTNEAMNERLYLIEKGWKIDPSHEKVEREIIETRIEDDSMKPISLTYNQITGEFKNIISKITLIFRQFKYQSNVDQFQKTGRLNKNLIKAITSDFKYQKCFTKKIYRKQLKILLLVDISGSMHNAKLESAKIAMVMLCEALKYIANIRIVLFTGEVDVRNILVKDFNENLTTNKIDKFGQHEKDGCNLDGITIKKEAEKLKKDEIIIVISDGQPSGHFYNHIDAISDIHLVRKTFKVFAFSIDAHGKYLDELYGNNWILTTSNNKTDLSEKIIKFCRLVAKEFFN